MASSPKAWPTSRASAPPQQTGAPGRPRLMPRGRSTAVTMLVTGRHVLGVAEQPFGAAPMSPRQAQTGAPNGGLACDVSPGPCRRALAYLRRSVAVIMDVMTGYVVAAGAGLAGDPSVKASRQPAGGALSVFRPASAPGRRCMCMTGTMNASACWTARCLSAAGAGRSTPQRTASCSCRAAPAPVWGRGPCHPAAAYRRPGRHRRLLPRDRRCLRRR